MRPDFDCQRVTNDKQKDISPRTAVTTDEKFAAIEIDRFFQGFIFCLYGKKIYDQKDLENQISHTDLSVVKNWKFLTLQFSLLRMFLQFLQFDHLYMAFWTK